MDILLATINAKWIHPSLALRLLKTNLGSLENTCEIIEFALRQPLEEKVQPIIAARPRILALSISIWNHLQTLELLKVLYTAWQQTQKPIVVLGGPEVSWLPEDAEIFHYADYVIRGEGEESFHSLCLELLGDGQPTGTDEGKYGNTVFINRGSTIVDVNKTETAYRLYTDEDLGKKLVYVEASRGCPFGCEFCQASLRRDSGTLGVSEFPVRNFPIEAFLADMETLLKRGAKTFKFLDRTFNLDIERAMRIMGFFLERIEEAKTRQEKPPIVHFEMVPSRFPPEMREIIRRFPPGTLRLEIGIQTLNPETSSLIHRAGDVEGSIEVLEFLRRETNAILHVDLIAGLPGEDLSSFGAGFDRLWRALSGAGGTRQLSEKANGTTCEIQLGILKCLPGTPIARHNETHGMRYSSEPPYEVIETGVLSKAELDRIKNFARFWELIVNRNAFPALIKRIFLPGEPAFGSFMRLSDRLLGHFGRNWGIGRKELKAWLEETFP